MINRLNKQVSARMDGQFNMAPFRAITPLVESNAHTKRHFLVTQIDDYDDDNVKYEEEKETY